MKSLTLILVLMLVVTAICISVRAQQNASTPKTTVAKMDAPTTSAASSIVQSKPATKAINPDQAYKANCSRCHVAPRKFSDRATATIMRHMRVRANLTQEETKAILQYLTE